MPGWGGETKLKNRQMHTRGNALNSKAQVHLYSQLSVSAGDWSVSAPLPLWIEEEEISSEAELDLAGVTNISVLGLRGV